MRRPDFAALPALAALALAALAPAAPRAAEPHAPPRGGALATVPPGIVDVPTAKALVAAGARLVDVRTPGEFAAGHAEGAVNIPFDEVGRRHGELGPPGTPVVLYCRSGRRSDLAAQALKAAGFTRIWDFQRYDLWTAAAGKPARP